MARACAVARRSRLTDVFAAGVWGKYNMPLRLYVLKFGSELCLIKCFLRTVESGVHIYKFLKYTIFTTH